jgi:hypothetical protein
MKKFRFWLLMLLLGANSLVGWAQSRPIQLSQQLLHAIYTRQNTDAFTAELNGFTVQSLGNVLTSDSLKKAFWINIYNASVQMSLVDSADRANEKVFFNRMVMKVAGEELSLNDIEHGLLRISKSSKGNKKRNKWFVSDFERQMRLTQNDWRIYFALNTGLASDPYIAFHSEEGIDRELDPKMRQFVPLFTENQTLRLNSRFNWYLSDAGSTELVKSYLSQQKLKVEQILVDRESFIAFKPRYFIGMK